MKQRDFGEADRLFSFFTEEFGRIEAVVQGVRYLKSKLRYSLDGFSILNLGFVAASGEYWRLIDVSEAVVFENTRKHAEKMNTALRIVSLPERLVRGRETDRVLWEKLKQILFFLENNDLDKNKLINLRILAGLRFLRHLGYLEDSEDFNNLSLEEIGLQKSYFSDLVKRSLLESQL